MSAVNKHSCDLCSQSNRTPEDGSECVAQTVLCNIVASTGLTRSSGLPSTCFNHFIAEFLGFKMQK
ncbi:rCG35088 [Rattus norvegicus]|uniref:RCG35088 n=1 Tax=Rattus norvegicus TaxID=10116 RepID=A6HGX3_RAT|nr:rCG35088 [Rattus norvegicus]